MEIAWDPIEEADSYRVQIAATDGDHEYRGIYIETIADTSLMVDIPVDNPDDWYELGSVVIFTVIPAKAGIQRPLAANAYLPATGFRVPAFAGMTETDAWRPIFLN